MLNLNLTQFELTTLQHLNKILDFLFLNNKSNNIIFLLILNRSLVEIA
jgi:hypothetical protein